MFKIFITEIERRGRLWLGNTKKQEHSKNFGDHAPRNTAVAGVRCKGA